MTKPKVAISDSSGNEVAVTINALDVHIAGGASIDIGDVEILGYVTVVSAALTTRIVSSGGPTQFAAAETKKVDIMSSLANTGVIYVGGTGVTAATGIALYPGDVYSVSIRNTDDLYGLPIVDGETLQITRYV